MNFATGDFAAKLRRNDDRIQVQLARDGRVGNHPIRVTKGVTLNAASDVLEISYLLEELPNESLHFGVELNFAGMPAGAEGRYFHRTGHEHLGDLGTQMALSEISDLALTDQWLGLDVRLDTNRPTHFWTYPVQTVSQSEGGFELVHQSVVVQPHWFIVGDAEGRWSATIRLTADTSLAESRLGQVAETVAR